MIFTDENGKKYEQIGHYWKGDTKAPIVEPVDEPEEWPKKGSAFYAVDHSGRVREIVWEGDSIDIATQRQGIYRTEHEAEMEKLRREARAKAWRPKNGEKYFFWDVEYDHSDRYYWSGDTEDLTSYNIGNVHKTEADAEAWKATYFESFFGKEVA